MRRGKEKRGETGDSLTRSLAPSLKALDTADRRIFPKKGEETNKFESRRQIGFRKIKETHSSKRRKTTDARRRQENGISKNQENGIRRSRGYNAEEEVDAKRGRGGEGDIRIDFSKVEDPDRRCDTHTSTLYRKKSLI